MAYTFTNTPDVENKNELEDLVRGTGTHTLAISVTNTMPCLVNIC